MERQTGLMLPGVWLRRIWSRMISLRFLLCGRKMNIRIGSRQSSRCRVVRQTNLHLVSYVVPFLVLIAVVELLGHLTWPVEFDDSSITVNHHRHLPYLRQAQVRYKRALLHHWAKPLRAAVRLALPAIALSRKERTPRDEGIVKLILFFLRNVAMISVPNDVPTDIDDSEVSRSTTIEAFQAQDIFQLLLTLSSGMGDEFSVDDVTVLETLFHLLKGIEPDKLFMNEQQLAKSQGDELKDVLQKEKSMLAEYSKHAPSRHNRFGTMIWLDRGEENYSTVPGQKALASAQDSLQRMDESKKWNKPKRHSRQPEKKESVCTEISHVFTVFS